MDKNNVRIAELLCLCVDCHLLPQLPAPDLLHVLQCVNNQLADQCNDDGTGVAPDVDADPSIRTSGEAQDPLDLPGEPASRIGEDRCLGVPEL